MDYEQLGTTAVINAVSKTSRLKAFVNNNEKEPSFDGNIYIYDNNKYSKDNLKRVSVQVKGKGVCSKPTATIKYPVSIVDLDNYMRNGGVMFFVVYIDKDTGDSKQIYYSSLLPFKIRALLKNNKENKRELRINLSQFPSDPQDMTDLFLNFYTDAQKQVSFAGKELPTLDELQNKGLLESITFSYTSVKGTSGITAYPKLLDGKEMYLYANVKGGIAPIPVDYYTNMSQLHMGYTDDVPISVNCKVYYENIEKIISADEIVYRIGSGVTITAPNVDYPIKNSQGLKINISVNLKGTLKQRITAIEFLLAMLEAKKFEWDGIDFPVNFTDDELKKLHQSEYPEMLSRYKRVLAVFEKLHIKKDLPLDDLTKDDFCKLDALVKAVESDVPVRNVKDDLPPIVNMNFGGLHLVMLCEKQEDGSYKIWDYFDRHMDVCVFNDDGEPIPVSQYSIIKADDFLTVDNLYLQSIVEDFKRIEPQSFNVNNGNLVMLEMLKAYDTTPSSELLDGIKQMCAWLETVKEYLSDEVMLLNSLQVVRRERELTFAEKQKLYVLAGTDAEPTCKLGAFLLLDEQDEAEKLLNEIPPKMRDEFMLYPIMKFYTKTKEEKDNGQTQNAQP